MTGNAPGPDPVPTGAPANDERDDLQAVFLAYPGYAALCDSCAAVTRGQLVDLADTLCAHPHLCPDGVSVGDAALIARFLGAPHLVSPPLERPSVGVPIPSLYDGENDDPS